MFSTKFKQPPYQNCVTIKFIYIMVCAFFLPATTLAKDIPPSNTTTADQTTSAVQASDHLDTVETLINDNNSRLAALEVMIAKMQSTITTQQTTINQLKTDLAMVEKNTVLQLDGLLQRTLIDGHETAEFTNVNVQINNGSSSTAGLVNGTGNLIIGYHEINDFAPFFCSDPQYTNELHCIDHSETWGQNVRTGSHNLIMGIAHSYTSYSAIIAGNSNISQARFASVMGGTDNTASAPYASVSNGLSRRATGIFDWAAGTLLEDQ